MTNLSSDSANPDTREGQAVGAILAVKQKPWYSADIGPILISEVGDKIKVLQHFRKDRSRSTLSKLRISEREVKGWLIGVLWEQ
jgi:hypothetical protein